jgi:hypothetical protein
MFDREVKKELQATIEANRAAIRRLELANMRLAAMLRNPEGNLPARGYIDDPISGKRIYYRKERLRLPKRKDPEKKSRTR